MRIWGDPLDAGWGLTGGNRVLTSVGEEVGVAVGSRVGAAVGA
jgi:hypothetical protein